MRGRRFFHTDSKGCRPGTVRYVKVLIIGLSGLICAAGQGFMKDQCFGADNFMFGGDVVTADRVFKEKLTLAGANVEVRGKLENGLRVFGASVSIPAEVHEKLDAFGAHVVLPGTYLGPVNAAGANLVLSGTFEEDVQVAGAKITLAPTAVIKKNIRYSSAVFDRREGARVLGEVIRGGPEFTASFEDWKEKGEDVWRTVGIFLWIVSGVALLITGWIMGRLFPHQTERVVATISEAPWASIGIGFLILIGVPAAILVCLATVVGIPVAVIAGMVYAISLYISRIYFAFWIGRKVIGFFKKSPSFSVLGPLALGILLIYPIRFIPILGWILPFFFVLIGLGAFWTVVWQRFRSKETA